MGLANRGRRRGGYRVSDLLEYGVWQTMKSRCYNPKADSYERYGGRGIRVCERWMEFANFYADMGPRPAGVSAGGYALYSIERIDNDGDYEPGNCCWATADVQVANQRPRKTGGTWQAA